MVKIGAIGDFCMAVPAMRICSEECSTLVVTGKLCRDLARRHVPKAVVADISERCITRSGVFQLPIAVVAVWRKLLAHKPTVAYVLHRNWMYIIFVLPAVLFGCKIRVLSERGRSLVPGRNHRFEYLRFVGACRDDTFICASVRLVKDSLTLPVARAQVVLCPGGARNTLREDSIRRWPLERYIELARRIIAKDIDVIIAGAESDRQFIEAFGELKVQLAIGGHDLPSFIEFLSCKDVLVTHDSGPLHLAGLAGCSIVAIFGPTNPSEKVPLASNVTALWKGPSLTCCPCYDGRTYAHCGHKMCLQEITVEMVEEAVLQSLRHRK